MRSRSRTAYSVYAYSNNLLWISLILLNSFYLTNHIYKQLRMEYWFCPFYTFGMSLSIGLTTHFFMVKINYLIMLSFKDWAKPLKAMNIDIGALHQVEWWEWWLDEWNLPRDQVEDEKSWRKNSTQWKHQMIMLNFKDRAKSPKAINIEEKNIFLKSVFGWRNLKFWEF